MQKGNPIRLSRNRTPANGKPAERAERRRHGRHPVQTPITIRYPDGITDGFTRNLSYSGALVDAVGSLPPVGAACDVTIEFLHGEVRARGKVTRVNGDGTFAVDLLHVDENGELLLVVLL